MLGFNFALILINLFKANYAVKFTVYNFNGIYDIIDPYVNNSTLTTPEDVANYMGPSIYGVSFKDNTTIVDSFGNYHVFNDTIFSKIKKHNKHHKKVTRKVDNEVREINNLSSLSDYKEYYNKLYNQTFASKPKCIPLTSVNPAYNPYHESLTIGVEKSNIIYTEGYPLFDNPDVILESSNLDFCLSIDGNKGVSTTCTIRVSTTIEDSLTVSNSEGKSYNRSYGVVKSTTNSFADEISNTIDLAKSFSESNVISQSESDTNSNALEMATTITNSKSQSETDDTSQTHTNTHDESYVHAINSEDSHTRTEGGEHSEENNWNNYSETSHMNEYSRMDINDYNKNKRFRRNNNKILNKRLLGIGTDEVNAAANVVSAGAAVASAKAAFDANKIAENSNAIAERGNGIAEAANVIAANSTEAAYQANDIARYSNTIAEAANGIAEKGNKIAEAANKIAEDGNKIAREANGIAREGNAIARESNGIAREANGIAREGNAIAREGNNIARAANAIAKEGNEIARESNYIAKEANGIASYANVIAERAIVSQEEIARQDRELQIKLSEQEAALQRELSKSQQNHELNVALAGTRSTSTNNSNGSSKGGSKSDSNNWSNAYTSSSGISDSWSNSNGYSDSYVTGHSETNTSEHSQSDMISNSLSNSYTKEKGWSSENSVSNSFSMANTYGKTVSYSDTDTQSVDESKEYSINVSYEKSTSISKTYEKSIAVNFAPTENGCFKPALIPKLLTEVTIWACADYDEDGELVINYNKVYDVIEAHANKDTMTTLISCDYENDDSMYNTFNSNLVAADYFTDNKNAIISGMSLTVGEFISGKNKKWYFGLLDDGTLALTKGSFNSNTVRWSNQLSEIQYYNPKFEINVNGHLIITAESSIFSSSIIENEDISNYIQEKYFYKKNEPERIIIWDSLPKHLPFNVGYYGPTGYTLVLTDYPKNDNVRLTLYDEVGIKIWEIYKTGDSSNFAEYIGYPFPYEYNIPLNSELITVSDSINNKNDLHIKLDKNIKYKYTGEIELNCDNFLEKNDALSSNNGIYKFTLQETGNLVIKEGKRTMWSSLTANIDGFTAPYKLSFSPLGELILRDSHNFILWQTYNYNIMDNFKNGNEDIYKLVMTDDGELMIIDSNDEKIWSSLPYEVLNSHMKYTKPAVYSMAECNENNRVPFNYYIFSQPIIYNDIVIEKSENQNGIETRNEKTIHIEKNYYYNILPNEKLISIYKATLFIDNDKLLFNKNTVYTDSDKYIQLIAKCNNNAKINELVLENDKIYLKCNNNKNVVIANLVASEYYKLEIRYDRYLLEPVLVIIDTNTNSIEWSSNSVKFLNYIENNLVIDRYNQITISNNITTFDRLYSKDGNKDKFVYMSNENGLELEKGSFDTIREISLTDDSMLIDGIPFIKNVPNMKIVYDGANDKLINYSNNNIVWELYGNKTCNSIISNDNECNALYSVNSVKVNDDKLHLVPLGLFINTNYFNMTDYILEKQYKDVNNQTLEKYYYNVIYSFKVTDSGSLIINDKITIFEDESKNLRKPYRLEIINNNLYLRNSVDQFLWSTNNLYPSNRTINSNTIRNGEKLFDNERLKYSSYLTLYDNRNNAISPLYISNSKNKNMFIRCDDKNNSIVLDDGNVTCNNNSNSQVWSFWDKNPSDIISAEAHTVLIYNKKLNKCLYSDSSRNTRPKINDCTNSDEAKWSIPVSGDGFYRSFYNDLCLYVTDINKGNIVMRECDSNSIILDINDSYNGNSIVSPLNEDKCLGLMNNNNNNANLSYCDKRKDDQYWEIITV
ncbi:hypothetical protein BCR32DRAFT_240880 [Anaeromyces robustus]|uniref:Bulb-type lectin domain-containing protein n=1 Tax=Anaeromyces robustus TaxID=1754192 RepID=A0A1Y1XLP0_9FUNG|nr:hypothetical protein BCR32DRAFT_240880 [Anaeromyces robustus]|eukprot:ORX86615.1 hypothetical protein BCR32DRAFT_240880 [Anaeromyces robustus]